MNQKREGYWHYEHVHRVVLERRNRCAECHAGIGIAPGTAHLIDRMTQIDNCQACHVAE